MIKAVLQGFDCNPISVQSGCRLHLIALDVVDTSDLKSGDYIGREGSSPSGPNKYYKRILSTT